MGKIHLLAGLSIAGAFLSAGAVYRQLDGSPSAIVIESATPSRAGLASAGSASVGSAFGDGEHKAPPTDRRDVAEGLSSASLGRYLIEPAPGIQVIPPETPDRPIGATQQGYAIDPQKTSVSSVPMPRTIELSPDESRSLPSDDAERVDPGAGLAASPVTTQQPESEDEGVFVSHDQDEDIAALTSTQFIPEAGDADVGEPPEKSDAVTARTSDEIEPAGEPSRSPPPPHESNTAESSQAPDSIEGDGVGGSLAGSDEAPAPVAGAIDTEEEASGSPQPPYESDTAGSRFSAAESVDDDKDQDNPRQLASRVDADDRTITATERLRNPEAAKRREDTNANEPTSPPGDSVIYAKKLLRLLGHVTGPLDDRTDPRTSEAIRAFQRNTGRETTGEMDEELIAAMETALFAPFQHYIAMAREPRIDNPKVTRAGQATTAATEEPSGQRQQPKPLLHDPADIPAMKAASSTPAAETAVLGNQAMQPEVRGDMQEAAIPEQLVDLEPPSETKAKEDENNAPNAFEACATTGQQWDYVKTEAGFVLCEGLSLDARGWR